ncbi:MAG: hypothetical protein K8R52_00520 [Bacteroidales bacterium]|nr:hypothetical protein [Bacteroidales bacterium]
MSKKPGKISLFWQELRRRKVIKATAMYAATAFIIMEAADIMLPRLGLPDRTVTFLIVLLIAGFPITLILSWIFDITPKGIEKTESLEEEDKSNDTPEKRQQLFKLSNLVIAILLVTVCILLYPKLFNKDQFEDIRDKKGKITVAVMPFENLTGDTLNNVWQGGIQNLLISTLSNSEELQVRRYQTMSSILSQKKSINQASVTPLLAREVALDLETKTYILGKILKAGYQIRITAQLLNAETDEIYKTYQVDCPSEADVFTVSDSLGGMIRNYLEIKKFSDEHYSPEANESAFTNSPEAFGYYIHAYEAYEKMDLQTTVELLEKTIETDPEFIDAYIFLSLIYAAQINFKSSEDVLNRAYVKRDRLPVREKLFLDHLHAYHYETPLEEIMYCKQILEMDEMNSTYWLLLGDAYNKMERYEEAIVSFEKVIRIHKNWETPIPFPHLFFWMGNALHQYGDHKRENEVYELGLSQLPNNGSIIGYQAVCALSRGESEKADEYICNYRSVRSSHGWDEARILSAIGNIYLNGNHLEEAELFLRQGHALDPDDPNRMHSLAWTLIDKDINPEEGLELAEKAMRMVPDQFHILDTWGWGLYKLGRYEEALKALNKAWELRGPYDMGIKRHIQATEEALAAN